MYMNFENYLKRKSQKLAFLLRHDINYAFDEHGWRDIEDLIRNYGYTMELLENIISTNNKQRYEFNEDRTMIRARQGHSINVDVELAEAIPPQVLYHGTSVNSLVSIMTKGLTPGKRLHVHLSSDVEAAQKVGRRHGELIVLRIDARRMENDGVKFFLSNNGVWLTDYVAPEYISLIE